MGIIPPARVVAEDLTKANLREGLPNLLQMTLSGVGKQVTSESMDSCSTGGLGRTKNNQLSSSKSRVFTMHSSGPGPSGGAAGGSSQDPIEPRQEVSHLAMYISDEDEFADNPHQITPLLLSTFQDKILKGLTMVTSYQQRSLGFKEPTIMSQVM